MTKWTFSERYPHGKWWLWTHSHHLIRAVERYGLKNFEVEILNSSAKDENELINLEKEYIERYDSFIPNGYNLTRGGGSDSPKSVKNYELVDFDGCIYKIKNLRSFCLKNKLNYGAMCNMVSGLNLSSHGFALSSTPISQIRNPNQEIKLQEIDTGKVITLSRNKVAEFSNSIGSKTSQIWCLINGKTQIHKGLKLFGSSPNVQKRYSNISLVNKNGEVIVIDNIYQFCKKMNYSRSSFYSLINGEALEAYGWMLPKNKDSYSDIKQSALGMEAKIRNLKTGEILKIKNVSRFCREKNINLNCFHTMLSGGVKQYAGYSSWDTDLSNYKFPRKICYIKLSTPNGIIEAKNPKEVEGISDISAQTIYQFLLGKVKMKIGFTVMNVKYLFDYYPEYSCDR